MARRKQPIAGLRLPEAMQLQHIVSDEGWRRDDAVTLAKLQASLRKYGQLRPVLVRRKDEAWHVVDGRKLVAAMHALGWAQCLVLDMGDLPDREAGVLAFALEVRHRTNYAAVAFKVSELLAAGETPASLASITILDAQRIAYMDTLTRFDWSTFSESDAQHEMDWEGAGIVEQGTQERIAASWPAPSPVADVEPEPVPAVVALPEAGMLF